MYIKSIDEAVRKAISDASHLFKDRGCRAGGERGL